MLENLLQLVRENAGEAIIQNPVIPDDRNEEAISSTTESILNTMKSQASANGIESITSIFSGGSGSSANLTNHISANTVTDLMNRFGIDKAAASGIAAKIIPAVLDKFVHKTNDPDDSSFDLPGIIGSLTGGNSGIIDKIKGIFG